MRILVPMVSLGPAGGIEINTVQIARELARRGHEIYVPFVQDGDLRTAWSAFAKLAPVPTFEWSPRRAVGDGLRLRTSVATAARARPDVIYLNRPEHLVWGVATRFAARAPLVCHLHAQPGSRAVVEFGRAVTRFIAVSDFIAGSWTTAGVSADRISVVHNGISAADYRPATAAERRQARRSLGIDDTAFVVLYYGRIAAEKGIDTLLSAWPTVSAADRGALLLVAGVPTRPTSAESELLDVLRASATPSCRWLPMRPDVLPLLHAADAVVLPAEWQEPFGRVVIEAMACGLPAVATRVGGIPEILTGEFAAYLCEPRDPDSLAGRLLRARADLERDPELGARAVRHVADHFALAGTVDGVEETLEKATTGP